MEYLHLPLVMIRENTVKTGRLQQMQAKKSIELYFKYLDTIKEIEMKSDASIDEVEKFIKEKVELYPQDCKKLIEYKRNLYNGRFSKIYKFKAVIESHQELQKSSMLVEECVNNEMLLEQISQVFELEYKTSREVLWDIWKNEKNILCGLINYGENLSSKIKAFLEKPADSHNSKMQKMDNTLLKIYTRAILKPSPFSTFCGVKMLLDDIGDEYETTQTINHIQLNYVHVLRIWEMMSKQKDVMKHLHYKVNFSMRKEPGFYSVSKLIDMPEENGKVYEGRTTLVKIPENALINHLYCIRKNEEAFSYDDLVYELGVSGKEEIIDMLLDKKLIYCTEKPSEISMNIIGDFLENLREWKLEDIECVKLVIDSLNSISAKLADIETSDNWLHRNGLYKEIKNEVCNLYNYFGHEKWCENNVIYEDCIAPDVAKGNFKINQEEKKTLELLTEINLLFDVNVRTQTSFGDKFKNKYADEYVHTSDGTLISQIIDSNRNHNYLWENNMATNPYEEPSVINRQMDEIKNELMDYIKGQQLQNTKVINLDEDYLRSLAEKIPGEIKVRKKSYDYFLQKAGRNLVINNIYSGYLMYYSRFLQYFPQLWRSSAFCEYIDRVFNGREKICDIRVASGFNGNMRPKIAPAELLVPTQTKREAEDVIDYKECYFKFDEKENRAKLYNKKIGMFSVTSMGSLMPLYLPGITGILHSLFVNSLAFKDLNKVQETAKSGISRMPRIVVGSVVICRQSFRFAESEITSLIDEAEPLSTSFCKLNRWIRENDIPPQVFMRKDVQKDMSDMFLGKTDNRDIDMTARKPQYIDFYNPLCVKLFLKMCKDGHDIIFEEALPNYTEEDCYVQEGVCEVSYA